MTYPFELLSGFTYFPSSGPIKTRVYFSPSNSVYDTIVETGISDTITETGNNTDSIVQE